MIHTNIPQRNSYQKTVLGLKATPIPIVRIGIVGLGKRGMVSLKRIAAIPHCEITALCDVNSNALQEAQNLCKDYGCQPPQTYCGIQSYNDLCTNTNINLVYICTDWLNHQAIALAALNNGKHTAIEVPAAMTLHEIWQLIDAAEHNQRHCIMLENTIYDYFEATIEQMVHKNVLGTIVHAEGGYLHDLSGKWETWRMQFNQENRGDHYPTHGFAPLCKALEIHRKDRLKYLVSIDSSAIAGKQRYQEVMGSTPKDFKAGDFTSTLIKTANGVTISLSHNVMTHQPYDRKYALYGTEGMVRKYPIPQICLSRTALLRAEIDFPEDLDTHLPLPDSITDALMQKYAPTYLKDLKALGEKLDHYGGMAYFMDYRLIQALHLGISPDSDVYDMADSCAVIELSRISLEQGSMPVAFPDFTRDAKRA